MRHGDAWSDAHILNLSSGGLAMHSANPPSTGAYIEVRRGSHVIVGRVIWARSDRFGVRAQDRLSIGSLVANDPDGEPTRGHCAATAERRTRPRSDELKWRYVRSRDKGRSLQFVCIAALGFVLAACAYDAVVGALSRPLSIVSRELADAR
jgi:hypothetical protein